jgi:hypothetical protein
MGTWVPSLQHFPDLRYNLLALTHGAFVRQIPVQNASLHLIQSPHPFPPLSKNSIGVVDLSNSTCGGCETPWKLATWNWQKPLETQQTLWKCWEFTSHQKREQEVGWSLPDVKEIIILWTSLLHSMHWQFRMMRLSATNWCKDEFHTENKILTQIQSFTCKRDCW